MQYRYLGSTGLRVSELCMGTMTFGRWLGEKESHALLDRFAEAGGTFVDTANVYERGVSEEYTGSWLRKRSRHAFVVATKVFFSMGDGPNDGGLSRKNILAALDASLERLQTDYVDLYQVHCWDEATPIDETLIALDDAVGSGKVRYIGASNHTGWQLQKTLDRSRERGWNRYVCLQPLYNLLDRTVEWDLLPVCRDEGVGVIPWSPLRGGWLTGKYRRGMTAPPPDTRVAAATEGGWPERWYAYNTERMWKVIDELLSVSAELEHEPAAVALNWLKGRPGVTAPIIGARTVEQLASNLGCLGWASNT